MSSPLTLTLYGVRGFGGGPATFAPFRSYVPLWQAHQMALRSLRYWTVQSRCVHVADNARYSPSATLTRIPGSLPNWKIFHPSWASSETLPARTREVCA